MALTAAITAGTDLTSPAWPASQTALVPLSSSSWQSSASLALAQTFAEAEAKADQLYTRGGTIEIGEMMPILQHHSKAWDERAETHGNLSYIPGILVQQQARDEDDMKNALSAVALDFVFTILSGNAETSKDV